MLVKSIAIIAIYAVGITAVLFSGLLTPNDSNATSPAIATVVGVEKHSNPYGDRWIEVQPLGVPHVGLWVTESCALTLTPGDDWPSADPACH